MAAEVIERAKQDALEAEARRAQALKDREAKIQAVMNSMGDQIGSGKEKELIKKQERDYIKECIANDERAKKQDDEKKRAKKEKNIEVRTYLDQQVQDRKAREQNEKVTNKQFVDETLGQDADYKLQQ